MQHGLVEQVIKLGRLNYPTCISTWSDPYFYVVCLSIKEDVSHWWLEIITDTWTREPQESITDLRIIICMHLATSLHKVHGTIQLKPHLPLQDFTCPNSCHIRWSILDTCTSGQTIPNWRHFILGFIFIPLGMSQHGHHQIWY